MKPGDIGKAWGEMALVNKALVHLDLSFNKIEEKDTLQLSMDMMNNQSLVGLHFQGNAGKLDANVGRVDSLGFIRLYD